MHDKIFVLFRFGQLWITLIQLFHSFGFDVFHHSLSVSFLSFISPLLASFSFCFSWNRWYTPSFLLNMSRFYRSSNVIHPFLDLFRPLLGWALWLSCLGNMKTFGLSVTPSSCLLYVHWNNPPFTNGVCYPLHRQLQLVVMLSSVFTIFSYWF